METPGTMLDQDRSGNKEFLMKKKASGRRTRRTNNPVFKAQVAFAPLREDRTMGELYAQFVLHPNQIGEWKKQLLENAAEVFAGGASHEPVNLVPLHAKIGLLVLENYSLESALTKAGLLSAKP